MVSPSITSPSTGGCSGSPRSSSRRPGRAAALPVTGGSSTGTALWRCTLASLTGYIVGATAASRPAGPARRSADGWPAPVLAALVAEGILLAGVTAGWEIEGGHPSGPAEVALLTAAAAAMGIQSAAVRALGAPRISTTYLTGMLTGILADLAAPAGPAVASRLRLLAMLIVGAIASGITYTQAPRLAPLIFIAPLASVIGIAACTRTRTAGARSDPSDRDHQIGTSRQADHAPLPHLIPRHHFMPESDKLPQSDSPRNSRHALAGICCRSWPHHHDHGIGAAELAFGT